MGNQLADKYLGRYCVIRSGGLKPIGTIRLLACGPDDRSTAEIWRERFNIGGSGEPETDPELTADAANAGYVEEEPNYGTISLELKTSNKIWNEGKRVSSFTTQEFHNGGPSEIALGHAMRFAIYDEPRTEIDAGVRLYFRRVLKDMFPFLWQKGISTFLYGDDRVTMRGTRYIQWKLRADIYNALLKNGQEKLNGKPVRKLLDGAKRELVVIGKSRLSTQEHLVSFAEDLTPTPGCEPTGDRKEMIDLVAAAILPRGETEGLDRIPKPPADENKTVLILDFRTEAQGDAGELLSEAENGVRYANAKAARIRIEEYAGDREQDTGPLLERIDRADALILVIPVDRGYRLSHVYYRFKFRIFRDCLGRVPKKVPEMGVIVCSTPALEKYSHAAAGYRQVMKEIRAFSRITRRLTVIPALCRQPENIPGSGNPRTPSRIASEQKHFDELRRYREKAYRLGSDLAELEQIREGHEEHEEHDGLPW